MSDFIYKDKQGMYVFDDDKFFKSLPIKGQKDFTAEVWEKLDTFYQQWLKENGDER